ncbi:MAG: hypothetical protein K0S70_144 [Microbacterium sp.]|jgi:hypothetical protein|nr:hypothetical protein [Microbacterium sp.]
MQPGVIKAMKHQAAEILAKHRIPSHEVKVGTVTLRGYRQHDPSLWACPEVFHRWPRGMTFRERWTLRRISRVLDAHFRRVHG